MKKIITLILVVSLMCSIFTFPTLAQTNSSKISDNLLNIMKYWGDNELNKVSIEFNIECDDTFDEESTNLYYREKISDILQSYKINESQIANAISKKNYAVWLNKSDVVKIAESEYVIFVDDGNKKPVPAADHLYEEVFLSSVNQDDTIYTYDEVTYHYNSNNNIEWALILGITDYSEPMTTYAVIGDRVALYSGYNYPTTFYWVYDANKKEFFDICRVDWFEYEGLIDAINALEIGIPIGDADFDGVLSILDSTYIQRALASLCNFHRYDVVDEQYYALYGSLKYVSDYDCDGERTVMDATAIQMKLAKK